MSAEVVLWIKRPLTTYVATIPGFTLRVKNHSKFGENIRGMNDGIGQLSEMSWKSVLSFRPTSIEINNTRNPLPELTEALRNTDNNSVEHFLSRVKLLSLNMSDVSSEGFLAFTNRLSLLELFSFQEVNLTSVEWICLGKELKRLNCRGLDISCDVLSEVVSEVNPELLKLTGAPGVSIAELKSAKTSFASVRILFAEGLSFSEGHDAEDFLELMPQRFPSINTLIWDWNMVDPEVTTDDRAKNIVHRLVKAYMNSAISTLAVIMYTPCGATKHASGEMARLFSEHLPAVQLHPFASKGISGGEANFSLLVLGDDDEARQTLVDVIANQRNSIPDLRHLLPLINNLCQPLEPSVVADFGGFNSAAIMKSCCDAIQS